MKLTGLSKLGLITRTVVLVLYLALTTDCSAAEEVVSVWGDFTNSQAAPIAITDDGAESPSAVIFSGHVKESPDENGVMREPGDGTFKLLESSFGQAVSHSVPYYDFQNSAIEWSKKRLYYEHGEQAGEFAKRDAAFRYKALLYGADGEGKISARFDSMSDYWTEMERSRAMESARLIRNSLIYDPFHKGLRNALLDIYYDIAVADVTNATEMVVDAQKYALAFPGYLAPPGEFQISKEIEHLEAALPLYDAAVSPYFDLLKDPMGIDMARVDSEADANNTPFGYYMFKEEVPARSLYAPLYYKTDDEGNPVGDPLSVVDEDVLFTGYKDFVLIFKMEDGAAQTAAKLAKLYALRSSDGDAGNARETIGNAQQKAYTDGSVLNAIFSEDETASIDRNSGLIEAKASWAQGLSALSGIKSFLDGEANPLGLHKDFLALVQTDVPGTGDNVHKDSFNYFADLLIPGGATPGGQLKVAKDKYDIAYAQYEKVQINNDSIKGELQSHRRLYGERLREIAGAAFSEDPDSEYYTPEDNEGGQIYLQFQNIENARLSIEHNRQEIENLEQQVKNEIERRGKEHNINNLISKTYIQYGNKQAALTVAIGAIKAAQAAANEAAAAASSFGSCNPVGGIAHSANAGFQAASEMAKAGLEAQKEKLAAAQSAKINYLNDQISAAHSEMLVKNMLLGMHTLAIESQQAAVSLAQEMGRLQALLDEKSYLETEWKKAEEDLANRYFADPAHRILMDQYIIDAGFAFQDAQFWVYVLARALDYKRNTRFTSTFGGKTYTSASVFKLRNAEELVEMAQALWNYDQTANIGNRQGTQYVRFSVRDDFLGYNRLDENNNPAEYPDPLTGEMLGALEAFQNYLTKQTTDSKIYLEFDTVRTNSGDTFFSPYRWNEKIKWLSVKINAESVLNELMVYLEQSGTGFVRNTTRGAIADPEHPDRIEGEMTGYPIRYWYSDSQGNWRAKDTFGFGVNAVINKDDNAPAESWQKREFHEMPPAVTQWKLEIPLKNSSGQKVLNIDTISDVEIWFYNYYHARN